MKKSIYILVAFCLTTMVSFGQNLDCSTIAYNLSVSSSCNNVTLANNSNGNNAADAPSCLTGTARQDIWVTVTGTGNPLTITVSGGSQDCALAAYTSCIGGELDCANINAGNTGSITFPSTVGTTYLVQIMRRNGGNSTDMTFDICATDPLVPDGGDDPCTATVLPLSADFCATYDVYSNANATTTAGAPAPGCGSYSGTDVWFSVIVPLSGEIVVNGYPLGMQDGAMAIYSGTCGALALVECDDDDGIDAMPNIYLTGRTPGETLWIRMWEFGGNVNSTFGLCATEPPPPPTNATCDQPDPICSGTPTVFNTSVTGQDAEDDLNPGNDYGCLGSSPDPTWYYLEISASGNLEIDMSGSADIDFAIWGPFADVAAAEAACDSYGAPLDCSFSIAATETATVAGVVAGEVYVMVVTNYAGTTQTITVSDGGGNTATTDCTILGVDFGEAKGKAYANYNLISWTTLSERNNSHFIIEKRINEEFVPISDKIDGKNNSSQVNSYTFVDENAYNDVEYYKVTQHDFDGKSSSSEIIVVSKSGSNLGEVKTFPNPFDDQVKLQFNLSKSQNVQVSFVNQLGHEVYSENFECLKGGNTINLNTLFKSGLYFIKVKSDNNELDQTKKLIKK